MWPTHYLVHQDRVARIPPPRFTLTSTPYPMQAVEEFASGGSWLDGKYGIALESQEAFTASGTFIGGEVRDILVGFDGGRDSLRSGGRFIAGVLRDILVGLDAGRDELVSTGTLVSVSMRDPLIYYLNWPLSADEESLVSGGTFVGGALT